MSPEPQDVSVLCHVTPEAVDIELVVAERIRPPSLLPFLVAKESGQKYEYHCAAPRRDDQVVRFRRCRFGEDDALSVNDFEDSVSQQLVKPI